jgi:uncharacterized membrane protein YqjE
MFIIDAAKRFASNIFSLVITRIDLASSEIESYAKRYLNYLLMSILALFLCFFAISLLALFVIVLFWDTHRLQAILALASAFAISAACVGIKLRTIFLSKPALLSETIITLRRDIKNLTKDSNA